MYNHALIEKKWSDKWEKDNIYKFTEKNNKKFYVLDMFPYPSGKGLHVGHPKGYTATDIISRYKKMQGFDVLHPIGWDAFGLPAEQYAIDTGNHPGPFTQANINNFRNQLKRIGFNFDYNKEVDTSSPEYYRWTQWIFIQLYKKGLAEIKDVDVNWCEQLKTVLANEEVLKDDNGNPISERGGYPVVKKSMKQWVLKITEYAKRLDSDLDLVEWPEGLKSIQRKWIGVSDGAKVKFKIKDTDKFIEVFTTLPQTIYGVSYVAISPESKLLPELVKIDDQLQNFINECKNKKDFERTKINGSKKGVNTNLKLIHPLTNKEIDLWVAEYVLSHYGTGVVMGVPSGDDRDFMFAKENNIGYINILEDNKLINSFELNNLDLNEALDKSIELLSSKNVCEKISTFKLKDWLFSRQRYWGEPFPVLYDESGNIIIEESLPLKLPETNKITPSEDGTSPLSNLTDWVNVKIDGKLYRRDTNTMPQWAGSCWYYLAYILKNEDGSYTPLNSEEAMNRFKKWLPVDCYIGGQEHAVLHLLYSRFWHKFLYDIGVVPTKEPFNLVINQGMILDEKGVKMSKSKNNIINPETVIEKYGADSLRMYEMFMGPITSSLPWNDNSLNGVRKWLDKIYLFIESNKDKFSNDKSILEVEYNIFVKNITNNIEKFQFNLAISDMMIFMNHCFKHCNVSKDYINNFLKTLSLFAPFVADELNEILGNSNYLFFSQWPSFDETKTISNIIKLPIKINDKVRSVLEISMDEKEEEIISKALNDEKIKTYIKSRNDIKKTIYINNKILNFII